MRQARLPLLAGLLLLATACDSGPVPIAYGTDRCAHCHMGIEDPRFGAEAISATGRIWKFDSVEGLAAFSMSPPEGQTLASLWVSDYDEPGTPTEPAPLIPVDEAHFVIGDDLASPMGLALAAFRAAEARDAFVASRGGRAVAWEEVLEYVGSRWPGGRPARGHAAPGARDGIDAAEEPGSEEHLVVGGDDGIPSVSQAVDQAAPGARITVMPGVYTEPERIVIRKPLIVEGRPGAVLDGTESGQILEIHSDSVTIRGLTFRHVAPSYVEDRSAIKVEAAQHCDVSSNRFEDTFFGIYLANAGHCRVAENVLVGSEARESASGNGIHLWYSTDVEITDNHIRGHRDGIYFEFVEDSQVTGNLSEDNLRYGLHFMFSDRCDYLSNRFRRNGAGVAVMYTQHVRMERNDFADNWGNASFGLLLKDITDSRLEDNRFLRNSTALWAEGANRLQVVGNEFRENGWAVKIMADTEDAEFTRNNFSANAFDLTTNSRRTWSRFDGNYWDEYGGYDLDRDGVGDVPFRPVRLFALLVEQNEPSLVLLRSFVSRLLDLAEAVLPLLTPESLADNEPAMRPVPNTWRIP